MKRIEQYSVGVMTDQGNSPVNQHKKQEGQRHENKPSDFTKTVKDGGFDSGSNALHLIPALRSWNRSATVLPLPLDGP